MTDGYTDLPYAQVRTAIAELATQLNCPEPDPEMLGQCAWHLHNRGLDGVGLVLRYLQSCASMPDVEPPSLTMTAMDLAELLVIKDGRSHSFVAPTVPVLLLPMVGFVVAKDFGEKDALLFTCGASEVTYSKALGLRMESPSLDDLLTVDPFETPTCTVTRVDFQEGADGGHGFVPFHRHTELPWPTALQGAAASVEVLRDLALG
ncbi:hypothetical protein [Tropicibacter naphthalenivorans]|uniref:Uncharacterized protein n=1 Tax=Tropicibacter naphthalenivorans TaxID=441103 RepID=A0A0P1G1R1_9RHOB|nr:hypothetical protein [Tropicibacter naphthalenivorans]CUH75754.1 hypothetical protein TRN7648_00602 [Tropicibacter naphthalenivorans]SMC42467.1 hypothetical protein SAMN04488093_101282 [Tropicibacter naphthalenivorans]